MNTVNWIFCFLGILLSSITSLEALKNRQIPWFLHRDAVYYIDIKPNYTSKQARNICLQKNMLFTVSSAHIADIFEYITGTYGHIPSFWTYDNEKYEYLTTRKLSTTESCYTLSHRDLEFRKENCGEKMGFMCKRMFTGASMFFVNGTRHNVERSDVDAYCNPHSEVFDHVLQLCLIRYFKIKNKSRSMM